MNLWKLPNIAIAPDTVFYIFGFPVTNTLLNTWVSILLLLIIFYFGAVRRRNLIPSGFQNAFEWLIEGFLGLVESVAGKEKGRKFFPIVATFFLFIVVGNLFEVIPGIDTIGTITPEAAHTAGTQIGPFLFGPISNQITPWFRPATTDLNLDLAMALVSVVITQIFGFVTLGAKEHGSKYFNFRALKKGPLGAAEFMAGLLEIISELGRLISFSFRLFGNIFAGGVLLAVFAFLLPVVADLIFIPFEIFVAGIQAFVFSFLTLIFLQQATTAHSHEEHHGKEEEIVEFPAA
ncbi:MAG TPA: F0F1 ATP synthase subunit A [Ktedonobacteraceae bacterium]